MVAETGYRVGATPWLACCVSAAAAAYHLRARRHRNALRAATQLGLRHGDTVDVVVTPAIPDEAPGTGTPFTLRFAYVRRRRASERGHNALGCARGRACAINFGLASPPHAPQAGDTSHVRVTRGTKLGAAFAQWGRQHGLEPDSFRFLLDGNRVLKGATPDSLGMEDGDELDVFRELEGGA